MKSLILTFSLLVIVALGAGSTFATFRNTQPGTGNSFSAGTLNLIPTVNGGGPATKYSVTPGGDGINGFVSFGGDSEKIKPGEAGGISWTLQNSGSVAGLMIIAVTLNSYENGVNTVEAAAGDTGDPGELYKYMGVKLKRDGVILVGHDVYYGTISDLIAVLNSESQTMAAGSTKTYNLNWYLSGDLTDAGPDKLFASADDLPINDNIIQGDSFTLNLTFTLTQQ